MYLTVEQAISVLPNTEMLHTFYNLPFGLIGADWDRKNLIKKIQGSDYLEMTGEQAQGMGHGLAVYNKNSKQKDILFVETDMNKLKKLKTEFVTTER